MLLSSGVCLTALNERNTYRITSCKSKLIDLHLPSLSGSVAQLDRATAF